MTDPTPTRPDTTAPRYRPGPGAVALRVARVGFVSLRYGSMLALERMKLSALRRVLGGDSDRPFELPQAMRRAFEDLGTTYIKLGQIIASGEGLFPQEYVREFQSCLDRVRPFPSDEARRRIERALGRPIDQVFASFEHEPMAAASIAQVHAATLTSGEDVVVKVQRPDIARAIEVDLVILRVLAWLMDHLGGDMELMNPRTVVDDFATTIREELDFRCEASTMDEFNSCMRESGLDDCVAPRVHWEHSSDTVLVMERFHGLKLTDVDAILERVPDPEERLVRGMRAWMECLVNYGFFHGDVHAGNFLLLDDGRIGFLDFGITGRFHGFMRKLMGRYLVAFNTGAFGRLAEIMVLLGAPKKAVDLDALAKDLEAAYGPLLHKSFGEIAYGDILPRIQRVSVKHRLRLVRETILSTKQFIYFDRYARLLAPELSIFSDRRLMPEVVKSQRANQGRELVADHALADRLQDHYFSGDIDALLADERGADDGEALAVPPWDRDEDGEPEARSAKRKRAPSPTLLDSQVLMYAGAADHFMGPVYAQAFDRPNEDLCKLYEKAKHEQWNASTDVAWHELEAMGGMPPILLQALANVQTQLHYGELAALMVTSKIVGNAPDLIAKYYGSTQVMDEARHVEFFSRVIRSMGVTGAVSPHLEALVKDVYTTDSAEEQLLGMQVIVEGLAQTTFVEGAALAKRMDIEASGMEEMRAVNQLFSEYLMRYIGHDESRHVAFGVYYLGERFKDLSKPLKDRLQRKADEWSALVDATIEETRDDMAMVGIDVDHLVHKCTTDRVRRLSRIGLATA